MRVMLYLRGISHFFITFVLFISVLLCPLSASARNTGVSGFNLQLYSPATDPFGMWTVNTSKLLKPGTVYVSQESNFSGGQLEVISFGVPIKIVDQILTTNFIVSLGLTSFAMVGIDMPFSPYLKSASTKIDDDVVNPTADTFSTAGVGDIRIFTKWSLLKDNPDKSAPGVGLLVFSTLPSGDERKFLGNSQVTFGTTLIVDKTLPFGTISFNLGTHLIKNKTACQ